MNGLYEFNEKKDIERIYVPGNLFLSRNNDFFTLKYEGKDLEDIAIQRAKKVNSIESKIKRGELNVVEVNENYLERFKQVVEDNEGIKYGPEDDDPVLLAAIDILQSIKINQGHFK